MTEAAAWRALTREMDVWASAGRRIDFWWRDDDAAAVTPALARLLSLSSRYAAPLALAVIPQSAEDALATLLEAEGAPVQILQHGFSHDNHAPEGEKKQELGPHRDLAVMESELARGQARLGTLFGPRALPLLVPPWNRIAPALTARLPGLGIKGLSTFGPRREKWPVPGLLQVNCQLDPFAWKPARRFIGAVEFLAALVEELKTRRGAAEVVDEPLGLMTHHLYHDDAVWNFLESLLYELHKHGSARILKPAAAFGEAGLTLGFAPSRAGGKA